MRLRHDAVVELILKDVNRILQRDTLSDPRLIGAHITLLSAMYCANPYSGGGQWWNPSTGERLARRPKVHINVISGELTGDDLCTCPKCESEAS